jgi:hypothetical protein
MNNIEIVSDDMRDIKKRFDQLINRGRFQVYFTVTRPLPTSYINPENHNPSVVPT